MTIPASALVVINPGVIGGGGAALDLNGVILTANTAVPIGTVQQFANPTDVATFFGASSTEAALAVNYFLGYENSTAKPGRLFFAQYPTAQFTVLPVVAGPDQIVRQLHQPFFYKEISPHIWILNTFQESFDASGRLLCVPKEYNCGKFEHESIKRWKIAFGDEAQHSLDFG